MNFLAEFGTRIGVKRTGNEGFHLTNRQKNVIGFNNFAAIVGFYPIPGLLSSWISGKRPGLNHDSIAIPGIIDGLRIGDTQNG